MESFYPVILFHYDECIPQMSIYPPQMRDCGLQEQVKTLNRPHVNNQQEGEKLVLLRYCIFIRVAIRVKQQLFSQVDLVSANYAIEEKEV